MEIGLLPEPLLEFRYGQQVADPRDGLSMFGPLDADSPSHPGTIRYGAVGTNEGLRLLRSWSSALQRPHAEAESSSRLWPTYPGFDAAFDSHWPASPAREALLDAAKLESRASDDDPYKRAFGVTALYIEGINWIARHDEHLDLIVCVVPDLVKQQCRPRPVGSHDPPKIRERKAGQLFFWDDTDPTAYQMSPDFRRQVKARCMQFGIPIQIVLESTLKAQGDSKRGLTPLSDRAWNLSATSYYKAGAKPWRLVTTRDGVLYIGMSYRRVDSPDSRQTACCAAQMFLDSGDGIVFLSELGPWYSDQQKTFHLSRKAAEDMLSGALNTYQSLEGKPLKEIFLHCRSEIGEDEFAGFKAACPTEASIVAIRVRKEPFDLRLHREGRMPVMRGSYVLASRRTAYLWGSGYKPRLGTYDGWETPVPLRIQLQYGEADLHTVVSDIFGLTKLNYNACRLGDSEPVTIAYSDAVGEILVANPNVGGRDPRFKFYI